MVISLKKFLLINIVIIILTIANIFFIDRRIRNNLSDYSFIVASKITKYIVNNAYVREKINHYADQIYDIVKTDDNEIKNIIYDSGVINDLVNSIGDRVYKMYDEIENDDLSKLNINANILSSNEKNNKGIVLEIPTGIIFNNYLFSNLGPKIPILLSLTGEYESYVSSDVVEYGINNAMVTVYVNIKVSEELVLPFVSEKISVQNKFPIFMSLVNGTIPNYYIGGFSKNSNIY